MTLRARIARLYARHPRGRPAAGPRQHRATGVTWLAAETGYSRESVHDWCSGRYPCPRPAVLALARLEAEAGI